jgi:hypothetical protein
LNLEDIPKKAEKIIEERGNKKGNLNPTVNSVLSPKDHVDYKSHEDENPRNAAVYGLKDDKCFLQNM